MRPRGCRSGASASPAQSSRRARSSRLLHHLHRAGRALLDAEAAALAVVGQHHIAAGLVFDREIRTVVNAVVALDAGAAGEAALGFGERLLEIEADLNLGAARETLCGGESLLDRPPLSRVIERVDRRELDDSLGVCVIR